MCREAARTGRDSHSDCKIMGSERSGQSGDEKRYFEIDNDRMAAELMVRYSYECIAFLKRKKACGDDVVAFGCAEAHWR